MHTRTIAFIFIAMLTVLPAFTQESEPTIEELYLQSSIKTQIVRSEAESSDRDFKMVALADINQMIDEGTAAENTEIFEILRELASEGVTNIVRQQGHIENDFPEVRQEAVRTLGRLGTKEAVQILSRVLHTDPEPMVMSEAILAISSIEVTDTTARDRSMAAAVYRQTAVKKDNNFAFSYLNAIENIVRREKEIRDPMLIEELAKIADARQGYIRKVRERAFQLLDDLQNL